MIAYKDRTEKLKKISEFLEVEKTFDDWYGYLINEWIIAQPDKVDLMALFIRLYFNPFKFVKYVIMGDGVEISTGRPITREHIQSAIDEIRGKNDD